MLSLPEYLLTKINEECIELADASMELANLPSNVVFQKEFSDEYNDILGVLSMFDIAGIRTEAIKQEVDQLSEEFKFQLEKDISSHSISPECLEDFISLLPRKVTKQALSAAKMACKCLVFGLEEKYVGSILHNSVRFLFEIEKLKILCDTLEAHCKNIYKSEFAQTNKRKKMAKYLLISLKYKTLTKTGFNKFNDIVNQLST
jgi:NTP pyrophosphatase (non-canonical NTP hydrolase)